MLRDILSVCFTGPKLLFILFVWCDTFEEFSPSLINILWNICVFWWWGYSKNIGVDPRVPWYPTPALAGWRSPGARSGGKRPVKAGLEVETGNGEHHVTMLSTCNKLSGHLCAAVAFRNSINIRQLKCQRWCWWKGDFRYSANGPIDRPELCVALAKVVWLHC